MMAIQREASNLMSLEQLLAGYAIDQSEQKNIAEVTISDFAVAGLALDSRKVKSEFLFLALPGVLSHGLDFVESIIAAGARAILWPRGDAKATAELQNVIREAGVFAAGVESLPERVGELAARFYAAPSSKLQTIGVTGTDGKTSVAHLLAQALDHRGGCGLIGTLGCGQLGALEDTGMTTPDAVEIQAAMAEFVGHGLAAAAMEVSSHALTQYRVNGTQFDVAVLTNLGRDHFDYHGTLDAYKEAKARLFVTPGLKTAVLNVDDVFGQELKQKLAVPVLGFGLGEAAKARGAVLWANELRLGPQGVTFTLHHQAQTARIKSHLLGEFNVSNILAVAAALLTLDWDFYAVATAIGQLRPVPGRMEMVARCPATAIVDYAHTPQALEHALKTLRPITDGKLWCVFGCGGDRDRGKRPLMAQAVVANSDQVILTDDNPRYEDPQRIVADALASVASSKNVHVEHDRKQAIEHALSHAHKDDVVLIAGKGHEQFQLQSGQRLAFSDRAVIEDYCAQAGQKVTPLGAMLPGVKS